MCCWWAAAVLAVAAVVIAQFNPNDESDYIDNVDIDEPSTQPRARWVSDTASTEGGKTTDIHGEVEKLLGQPIIHYEYKEPGTIAIPTDESTTGPTRSARPSIDQTSVGWSSLQPDVHWNDPEVLGLSSLKEYKSNKRRGRHRSTEVIYSVRVPQWDDNYPQIGQKLTVPGAHLTATTRRPRPTPITEPLTSSYLYTRRTRRHPNCTDSYYQCLFLCFDAKGYRVKCPWDTPTPRPEPRRLNFTGLFWAVHKDDYWTQYDVSELFKSFSRVLVEKHYRECRTFTTRTTTTAKVYPIYYDDAKFLGPKTGRIVAKCWVCGLRDIGIPHNAHCAENFGENPSAIALSEKNTYKRYCRYMNDVPLWFNRSDPLSVHGVWTGGCSKRWLDLSGLYTQRTCRSITTPAVGHHFLSKRMARLELALKDVRDGCVVSPMATLVPFSRAVSLYARFHVCVCSGHFCNLASRKELSLCLIMLCLLMIVRVLGF